MTAAKHTPGPWRAGRAGSVVADHPVPEITGSEATYYYGGHLIAESVAPQNVPLIAAAPALLDACKKALYALKGREHDQFLRDAIAKATGSTT